MRTFLLLGALLIGSRAAAAQAPAPEPCAADSNARRFDFWIGDWDVQTPQGQPAGRNVIERVSGGCALLENWTAPNGSTGKSLNTWNRRLRRWQQYWVGQFGDVTEFRESEWVGPSLVYYADDALPDGSAIRRRLTFTPIARDTVRQHGERSADGGRTWTTEYDLRYVRRGS